MSLELYMSKKRKYFAKKQLTRCGESRCIYDCEVCTQLYNYNPNLILNREYLVFDL